MKKLFSLYSLALVLILSSCIEQNYPTFDRHIVEFQDAVVRTPVSGQVYPRITVPNTVGTVTLQVNLVGAHKPADEVIQYTVAASGTTAAAGVDYTTASTLVIPKGSSFGTLTVNVINTGKLGGSVDLLLQIIGNDKTGVSPSYDRVQLRITR